jgi:hypothetical protein
LALSIGLGVPFDNMQDLAGIREKAGEVHSTKIQNITNDKASR